MTRIKDIVARTSRTYKLVFTDKTAGTAIDITGYTIYFTLKRKKTDADTDAAIKKEITTHAAPLTGVAYVELTEIDTDLTPNSYYYQFLYKTDDGAINPIVFDENKVNITANLRDSYV